MKYIARKALTIADELDQLLTDILDDDRAARGSSGNDGGFIMQCDVDTLEDAIKVLQDYGYTRSHYS